MIKHSLVVLTLSTLALASSLVKEAHNAGLQAIPSSAKALHKLTNNANNPVFAQKVELGKKLFFDPRLSKSGFISCNSCHNLATGGVDGLEAAVGHEWTVNPHHLNSPTVYNAVFMSRQFWDGRDPDLEKQAQGPIQAGPEMAATKKHVVDTISSIPAYVKEYTAVYGKKPITFERLTDAIAAFERTLVTPSRFDSFLEGDKNALTKTEQEGLKLFIDKGCVSCHNGVGIGGGMQIVGAFAPYKYANVGDFKGDANGMVKVPTLRNIEETAPYFHNGMVKTLKEAIVEMGRIQLGWEVSNSEAMKVEAFLKALTGDKPKVVYPVLPASTPSTPLSNIH